MARILFDTNAVIDLVSSNRPQHDAAAELLRRATSAGDSVMVFASSLKDAYYVLCRHYADEATARELVYRVRCALDVVDLTAAVVDAAFASDEPDFEDGLVRAAAEMAGCSVIVSRDVKAFRTSICERLSPVEALKRLFPD